MKDRMQGQNRHSVTQRGDERLNTEDEPSFGHNRLVFFIAL
ncbi:hypothetical protein [Virgibacillus ainsalahensis]